uniref:Crossover junction endodeoxyribonuclease Hjc n=1 Tax=Archaeoglobus fulgidus TaxID=2234 RepID=A0A7J2TGW6_ARCFL
MKEKGSRFERSLIEELWKNGFAAVRVAGSGISHFPCPDVVAGNGNSFFAFEVKMRRSLPLYISSEEIKKLQDFSRAFGAKGYIALKLPREKWKFFGAEDLKKTSKGYKIDEEVYAIGKDFSELKGLIQSRLSECDE